MQAFFAAAQEVIQRYDGTMTHVTSEGFTAVFGAPVGQEDHARRAVLAALELGQHLRLPPLGAAHAAGIGLHTGPVVVGPLASTLRQRYTAVGDTMHQALRLQHLATPGTILISAATYRLVQEEVQVAGASAVDGQGVPIPVYMLQGLTQRRAGVAGQGRRPQRCFVGRERELAFVHERLAHVAQGHGQVVGLVGDPGMGKSRLLAEFRRSLGGQPVRYREGHCFPYSNTIPYLPVRDLLRQGCGITDADGVEAILVKARQYLEDAHLMSEDDAPLLLQILDVPVDDAPLLRFSPQERKVRTFALLRHLVLHDSQRQPLVLAVENLHWVDPTSEAWLTALVEHLAGAAVLLLVTHRPGYQPPWLAHSVATQMALPPLLPEDSRAVVQSVLQTTLLPEPLLQTIVTKAAGNPFFLEELVWAVREQRPDPAVPGIPDTMQAVLAARIDRLPPAEKRLLQTAAVIGTEVAVPLLQAIVELPTEALHRSLAHLQATEFLYETRLFPELAYTFKHALTHEVAYGSLLHERRRTLHGRIVEALESLNPDRVAAEVERLAYHALRGERWEKALAYSWQAGAKAFARSALREAIVCFEHALVAVGHLPESQERREQAIDLRLEMRKALMPLGALRAMFDHLSAAERLATSLDDPRRLGWVSAYLTASFNVMGDHDRAVEAGQRALTIAMASRDFALEVMATFYLGLPYLPLGDYRQAVHYHRKVAETLTGAWLHERFGTSGPPAVIARAYLTWSLAELGEFAEGMVRGAEAVQIAETTGEQPYTLSHAYLSTGLLRLRQGDFPQAIAVLERSLGLCQAGDIQILLPYVASSLGYAYALAGRLAEALPLLEQAVEHSVAVQYMILYPLLVAHLGEAYLLAGRIADAGQQARQALERSRDLKQRGHEAYALRLLGEIAAQRQPLEAESAAAAYRQALILADELGMRPLQAHCHRGLGTLYAATGQREQARSELTTAIAMYTSMEMTFWLPQSEAALAQVDA
jgi:predicted ATPase